MKPAAVFGNNEQCAIVDAICTEQVTFYVLYSVSSHMNDEAWSKARLNGLVCGASSRTCDREKSLLRVSLMS